MRSIPNYIQRLSPAVRGVAQLSGGTAAAQLVLLLSMIVLARIYEPAAFGIFAAVSGIVSIVAVIATLNYSTAIAPAGIDEDTAALARVSFALCFSFAALMALAVLILGNWISGQQQLELMPYLWFAPLLVLLNGLYSVFQNASLRQRRYGAIASRSVVQSVGTSAAQFVLGLLTQSAAGLLGGDSVGRALGVGILVRPTVPVWRTQGHHTPLRTVIRKYRQFPLKYSPAVFVEVAATQAPILLVAVWFGSTAAGYLGFTTRILAAPLALVSAAIAQVFLAELSSRVRAGRFDNLQQFHKLTLQLWVGAVILAAAVIVAAPFAFSIVFGDEWRTSGDLARALAIPLAVGFVWNPLANVYVAYQATGIFLLFAAARLIVTVLAGSVIYWTGGDLVGVVFGMAIGTAIVQVLGWVGASFVIRKGQRDNALGSLGGPSGPEVSRPDES